MMSLAARFVINTSMDVVNRPYLATAQITKKFSSTAEIENKYTRNKTLFTTRTLLHNVTNANDCRNDTGLGTQCTKTA